MPQTELLKDKGYEILYCTDDVDEFALKMLISYDDKMFKSVSESDLDLDESEEEKKKSEEQAEESKDLLDALSDALSEKVSAVKLSKRLKSHPVVLVSGEGISLEMEKVLKQMPGTEKENIQAEKILEINANHKILEALNKAFKRDKESIKPYAELLYDQALLMEGMPIDDPVAFSNSVCKLIELSES